MESILIFGHKNPDTDSVCASISLSYLKNHLGANTAPRVLGHINKESKFVLDYFKVKEPEYLNNVKVQLRSIDYNKEVLAKENMSVKNAMQFMQDKKVTALPIIQSDNKLLGFVTLKEIATLLVNGVRESLNTNYQNIIETLDGSEILRFQDEIEGNILIGSYQSQTFVEEVNLNSNHILIIGDRYKVLNHAIEQKIKLIILTGNHQLPSDLLEKAKENKINVIATKLDTFNTGNLITLSNYVKTIVMNTTPITVLNTDYRTDFIDLANKIGHTNYPLVNKKQECLGLIKITDVDKYEKQKVILVDHNNLAQSVPGIEEADIEEIIDHHNLGAIGTSVPINFRSMPVGCTCTIIYKMYQEFEVNIPKDIAGLMLSAILSDTLIFQSPTTTEEDRVAAEKLAQIADVEIEKYGREMLTEASSIKGMTIEEVFYQDFKSYKVANTTLGISQIITMDFENIKSNMTEYITKLDEIANGEYGVVTLFITDVIQNGSYILFNQKAKDLIREAFNLPNIEEGTFIPGLVSRKKQMLPNIMETLEKRA
ncbi:MAG: putative manganese-dependent inorganic diphosphatase [Bacilli bacterium]|jgi:manganese-dependent inorganic pyrophosphatase|nr:putative manganese-dependent inorganic diphosphatase [Bacilli bacterium]